MTPEEFFTFHDQFVQLKETTIKRGVPCMLIASMPRSASVFFTYQIAKSVSAPVCSITHHNDRDRIMASAFREFVRGGSLNHDHFHPSAYNVALLQTTSVTKIILRLRDPRHVIVSLFHKAAAEEGARAAEDIGRRDFVLRLAMACGFIRSWGSFIASARGPQVKVMWFEDMVQAPTEYAVEAGVFFGLPNGEVVKIRTAFNEHKRRVGELNFRDGRIGQWRQFLSREQITVANDALAALADDVDCAQLGLRHRLGLQENAATGLLNRS